MGCRFALYFSKSLKNTRQSDSPCRTKCACSFPMFAHFVRHGLSLCLVFFKKFVAKRCARRIKHDSDIFRLVVVDQALENISKKEWNIGWNAAGARQPLRHRRKKCPVDVCHCIYEKQFFRLRRHAREYSKGRGKDLFRVRYFAVAPKEKKAARDLIPCGLS